MDSTQTIPHAPPQNPPEPVSPTIIRTNVLTKFHEDWSIHVTSRMLIRKYALWRPCFSTNLNHFQTLVIKFHKDWTINVTSRVLKAFEHNKDMIGSNFHGNQAINAAYRVLTRQTVDDA
ncbi:hypothetical protein DPMN_056642 [Dreissena polymorpha]|uniref:Uncharacterized protein n=1 Tax=Dreissena polymorpha TaxID=45954 RepID=A0A9D4CTN3_DREPO|nr:hypothetical protein DPMN_056642 [Dreissena polymorpha]